MEDMGIFLNPDNPLETGPPRRSAPPLLEKEGMGPEVPPLLFKEGSPLVAGVVADSVQTPIDSPG